MFFVIDKHGLQVHNGCNAFISNCNTAVNVAGFGIGFGPYTGAGGGHGLKEGHATQAAPEGTEPGGHPFVQYGAVVAVPGTSVHPVGQVYTFACHRQPKSRVLGISPILFPSCVIT